MRIRLKRRQVIRKGRNRTTYAVGEYTNVEDTLAQGWVDQGIAVKLDVVALADEPRDEPTMPLADPDQDSDPKPKPKKKTTRKRRSKSS